MKLYHYVHCPFCVRIRMVLNFLNLEYESIVLPYDDEKTPLHLMGVKMLPIMQVSGKTSNESLEIIKLLDTANILHTNECINNYSDTEISLNKLGGDIHSLAMPYFVWTPEFDEKSRKYFQDKKEKKRGPFKYLVKNQKKFKESLLKNLKELDTIFKKEVNKENIDLNDIFYASHLWAMYIVPEFQYPPHIHDYLQSVATVCNFSYHAHFWSE